MGIDHRINAVTMGPAGADHRQFFRYADHLLPASGCIPAEHPPGARGKAACSGRYDETQRQPPAK